MSYKINKEKTIDRLRELDSTFPLELKKILEEKHDLPARKNRRQDGAFPTSTYNLQQL